MTAFATVNDVAVSLGRPISDPLESAQVEAWLQRVDALIRSRIPDIEDRITDGLSVLVVAGIEVDAVIRKVHNPEGKVAEGNDVYNYRFNEHTRKGELFLTDDEWALLTGADPSAAFSTRPAFEPDCVRWP